MSKKLCIAGKIVYYVWAIAPVESFSMLIIRPGQFKLKNSDYNAVNIY